MVRRWLITGGCGFIGTALISRILADDPGAHVRVFDNLSVGTRDDLGETCDFVETAEVPVGGEGGVFLLVGDIRDADMAVSVTREVDCIVHLAANTGVGPSVEDPRGDMEANVIGIFNMLEGARQNGVGSFVFASSGAPAGIVEPPIHEEMAPHPVSPYGASKLAGEGYCSAYFQTFGIRTVCLRFGNVYGPGSKRKSSVVAKFVRQALKDEVSEIYGDGTQTRDFIFIGDLVEAIIKASHFEGGGEVFQIAAGNEVTLNELVDRLKPVFETVTGRNMEVCNAGVRLGDVKRNFSDTRKAREVLGWEVSTGLDEGLRITVEDLYNVL